MANYKTAKYETKIEAVKISGREKFATGFTSGRGGIFYDTNKFISSSIKLIKNDPINRKVWNAKEPLIDFNKQHHQHTLGDLSFPYVLSKKANNDTVVVFKDKYRFLFKLNE